MYVDISIGSEDWHPIAFGYGPDTGCVKRFWGAQCAHFTAENTTPHTRVSLDFRVIEDTYWLLDHDHFCCVPGYYATCVYMPEGGDNNACTPSWVSGDVSMVPIIDEGKWVIEGTVQQPDWRVGFPFEKQ